MNDGSIIDESMLELFKSELSSHTETISKNLLQLEKGEGGGEILESLMRACHSIKGACRLIGIDAGVNLTHRMEDYFVALQEQGGVPDSAMIDTLLEANDILESMQQMKFEETSLWSALNADIIDRLIAAIPDRHSVPATEQADSDNQVDSPTQKTADRKTIQHDNEKPSAGDEAPATSQSEDTGAESKYVRINTDRLNNLISLAGELNVSSKWINHHARELLQLKKLGNELHKTLCHMQELQNDGACSYDIQATLTARSRDILANIQEYLNGSIISCENYDRRILGLTTHLNHELLTSRMRPFSDITHGFERMTRDISRQLGKNVRIEIEGRDTLVDRDILEKLEAPINHLIRNAIDHGIEDPETRKTAGKPEQGVIRLTAAHNAGMLSINICDDGKGIDLERLKTRILDRKLSTPALLEAMSEAELLEFLYLPGFSTREEVTEISGRGVGLDVVLTAIQEIRGNIRTCTEAGKGTSISLELPLTLSILRCLLATINGELYGFPLARIDKVLQVDPGEILSIENHQYIHVDEDRISLVDAASVLQLPDTLDSDAILNVIIVGDRSNRYGLVVDRFNGEYQLAIRSLPRSLGKIRDVSATALTDKGETVLIIDIDDILKTIHDSLADRQDNDRLFSINTEERGTESRIKRVLVVDDSLTVREVEKKLLESRGYIVDVAVDGIDGLNSVRSASYDLVISDIDMPRMNGIDLVSTIKSDNRIKDIPVMIVSYKDRPEDRKRGLEAGADYYLTKGSFHDESLIDAVLDLIGEAES